MYVCMRVCVCMLVCVFAANNVLKDIEMLNVVYRPH